MPADPRPLLRAAVVGAVLSAGVAAAQAQAGATQAAGDAPPADAKPAPEVADHSYLIPAVEIFSFDFLLNRYNRRFSGVSDYDVSWSSIHHNLRGPWVTDNDPFKVNQFAHPYQGSIYHSLARSSGLGYWTASAYTFLGSVGWEIAGEQTPPAINDQIASGIAGSFFGEPLFRMARLMLKNRSDVPYDWRVWGAALVSPAVGFNRLVYGTRFDAAFDDHDPIYYGRLRLGASRATRDSIGTSDDFKRDTANVDVALDYGLPGQPGYTYDRPFDYFSFQLGLSSANGVESLTSNGLLFGAPYEAGDNFRGIWGLYGNYDYLAPQIFNISTTALSLGSTGQWWLGRDLALQGTVLGGVGYSAVSSAQGVADDRNYRYGTAPRLGASLRLVAGSRASFDVAAQKYLLGRISHRGAGRDTVSHLDAALTFRVAGRHGVGFKYMRSERDPGTGTGRQTLGTFGLYYTLLGLDSFGTVDWRGAESQ